jgi:protoheme IX farnesyltransferase
MSFTVNIINDKGALRSLFDDFKQLTKVGLSLSVVFSAVAGYLLGAETISVSTVLWLSLGGYLMVGASNAFNQVVERGTDALMKRTMNRPLPTKRMSTNVALIIAFVFTIFGLGILYSIHPKCALFGAISIFLYTSAYTPLKAVSPLSVFVGAIPGAIPFMLGWVAATGEFGVEAGTLFLIQFFWQFPHFWAIAWLQYDEYKKAGFNLMPMGKKDKKAVKQIIFYTIIMILASIAPVFGFSGTLSLSVFSAVLILLLGFVMLYYALRLYIKQNDKEARNLMLASVIYISVIQVIYVLDKFIF